MSIKSVAIYTHQKPQKAKTEQEFLEKLVDLLQKKGVQKISGDLQTMALLQNKVPLVNDKHPYDLKIAIGGDGMILKIIRTIHENDGVILGINFGTLGFLSELSPNDALENIEKICEGQSVLDERIILECIILGSTKKEKFHGYALNEFVVNHGGLARLSNFQVSVGKQKLSTYRSDGIIFATPTGSTAYSLSAGGPIISPEVEAILITPISPHTLSHRPIVLDPKKDIELSFDGRTENLNFSIDGQVFVTLQSKDTVIIRKSKKTARFIRLTEQHYFETLKTKLNWGERA